MSRATDDLMDQLHGLMAESLVEEINAYRLAKDEEGNPAPKPIPPALLSQALKFLKDNGIDQPARAKEVADKLAGHLPNFDDVEDEHRRAH